MLNSNVSTLIDKVAVSSTTAYVRSSGDSALARSMFRGTISSSNPYIGFYTYAASSTSTNNYIQLHFDGTNFYVKGQKGGAAAVSKKLDSGLTSGTLTITLGGGATALSHSDFYSRGSVSGKLVISIDGSTKKATISSNTMKSGLLLVHNSGQDSEGQKTTSSTITASVSLS